MTGLGRTSVVLDSEGEWPDDHVLAVDTDSRHRDPELAAARVAGATRRARRLGARVVKKLDSTLRGHVAVELRAMTEAVDERGPAGRGPGVPGHPADHPRRRRARRRRAAGRARQRRRRGRAARRWRSSSHDLPQGDRLAARMAQAHADGFAAVVVDAETDEDLAAVVAAADELAAEAAVQVLLAGSGGLTRPMAGTARPPHEDGPASRGPTLVVVGSYSARSRAQRSRLVEAGVTPLLLADGQRLRPALHDGPVVLSPDPEAPVVRADATAVAQRIAETVAGVLDDVGTLVLTGGETARAVLTAAGVSRLVVAGELEPGVVRAHVPELDLDVITKAGAFGDPDALLHCLPSYSAPAPRKEPHEPSSCRDHDGRRRRRRTRDRRQGARRTEGLRRLSPAGHR